MRIIKIIISLFFVLGSLHSCSAQKELQRERCSILNDVFQEGKFIKISTWILMESDIKSKRVVFDDKTYFNIDSLNYNYVNQPMYRSRVEYGNVENLLELLTSEDLQFMKKQFKDSNNLKPSYFNDCLDSSAVFSKDSTTKNIYNVVSLPLLSKDHQKCMFLRYANFERQAFPEIFFCIKENGIWKDVAHIDGDLYDTSVYD